MIVFGARAPLVVDYEISAQRLGSPVTLGISLDEHPRMMFTSRIIDLVDVTDKDLGPMLPCAFAPERRACLAQMAVMRGFTMADSLIDPSTILPPGFRMGAAGFINAGVVIGGGCFFGEGVLVNRSASIGHHVVLGDWVSIGPGAVLSGNIRIGERSMIGAGAVLQSDIRIGSDVLVAAGSVVRKSVPCNHLVSGNPARSVPRRPVLSILGREGNE
jgi:hypothetical protein